MKRQDFLSAKEKTLAFFERAGIAVTAGEKERVEVADFGLNQPERVGLNLITFVNTERCCAKEMVLFPNQTCPEHRHPPVAEIDYPGKEETFRCRMGCVRLYVEGEPAGQMEGFVPDGFAGTYTVFHEIILHPGEQYTIQPNTKHWFQAGGEGAVVSEFSTKSLDEYDIFTDPDIKRIPEIEE